MNGYPADTPNGISMPSEQFEQMLRNTAFAMDRDRSSAVLGGVCLQARDTSLIMVATDGKVLAEARYTREESYDGELSAIIPAATVSHLQRIIHGSGSGHLDIALTGTLIHVRSVVYADGNDSDPIQIELSSRLIEGNFPAYRNAIPAEAQQTVTFDSAELASAVRRTALMTSSGNRGIIQKSKQANAS